MTNPFNQFQNLPLLNQFQHQIQHQPHQQQQVQEVQQKANKARFAQRN